MYQLYKETILSFVERLSLLGGVSDRRVHSMYGETYSYEHIEETSWPSRSTQNISDISATGPNPVDITSLLRHSPNTLRTN